MGNVHEMLFDYVTIVIFLKYNSYNSSITPSSDTTVLVCTDFLQASAIVLTSMVDLASTSSVVFPATQANS